MSRLGVRDALRRPSLTAVHRQNVRLLLEVASLFLMSVVGLLVYFNLGTTAYVAAKPIASAAQSATITPQSVSVVATTPSPSLVQVATAQPVPQCKHDTTYQLPLQLPNLKPGLQQVVDTPSTYTVHGNDGSQVLAQIARCTPVHSTSGHPGIYAASTAYAMNWQFSIGPNSDGSCGLDDVAVGLHINQVFPSWQGSPSNHAMATEWQRYITKLRAYEAGHARLNEVAANGLMQDLQNFPATDCNDIIAAATAKATADVHANDVANANYDIVNNYGLKQGIILWN